MKNLSLSVLLILTFGVLAGCIEDSGTSAEELEGSTYTGVTPCADCEGIAYKITLKDDNQFETSSVYIGKSNRAITERGTWTLQGDSLLILNQSEENSRTFKIKNDQLIMLDRQGNEVFGSLSKMYTLNEADTTATDQRWQERREQGIDFRAAGNEPSWSLDIDFDKMMTFHTLNGDSIQTPLPKMQQDTVSKARVWKAEVESGSLRVELSPTGCVDDMSGEVFNYQVSVSHNGETYSGCGSFINATYKLNDFWTLHRMNGEQVKDSRQIPALQFDLAANKVYGNTGCNQLNGTITLDDSSLTFSKLITTKMACPGNTESQFLDALQQVDTYEIANAELLLMSQQDTLLTFRRTE